PLLECSVCPLVSPPPGTFHFPTSGISLGTFRFARPAVPLPPHRLPGLCDQPQRREGAHSG
ncbi:hypothetical protein NGA_2064500, partial [Nannochloropsis gaditana CCMP526]|uniref:uncharacterized protein n=1 Tax=Nannochloropsis gaditana (strain CCMP526) TaxID=1093141 RepID=UPI00029F7275